jgi:Glyoxalase-like domain
MNWELDHVYVAVADPGLETVAREFGMTFTEWRVHRGQGTANACAIFENAFFELLFPADVAELTSDVVRPLGLDERTRWRETGACPFGICFRPTVALEDASTLPFETWPYRPSYLPAGASMPIVTPRASLPEPMIFLMTRPRPQGAADCSAQHRGAKRTLSAVSLQTPHGTPSPSVQWFIDQGLLGLRQGPEYLLELEWDEGRAGSRERLADPLPVVVRW